jgi:hypothetical protein
MIQLTAQMSFSIHSARFTLNQDSCFLLGNANGCQFIDVDFNLVPYATVTFAVLC